uniref:Uncharacterized protein n=1 Tax=Eutreptiella gymnastica TaxID=73025 RepID=A0A7S1I031_9EUGL
MEEPNRSQMPIVAVRGSCPCHRTPGQKSLSFKLNWFRSTSGLFARQLRQHGGNVGEFKQVATKVVTQSCLNKHLLDLTIVQMGGGVEGDDHHSLTCPHGASL